MTHYAEVIDDLNEQRRRGHRPPASTRELDDERADDGYNGAEQLGAGSAGPVLRVRRFSVSLARLRRHGALPLSS
jgi:hypothetical protein